MIRTCCRQVRAFEDSPNEILLYRSKLHGLPVTPKHMSNNFHNANRKAVLGARKTAWTQRAVVPVRNHWSQKNTSSCLAQGFVLGASA